MEDYAEPMFALRFAFRGGSAQDPPGKEGLANFFTLTLAHGGGELNAVEFHQRAKDLAVKVEFNVERDAICGALEALSETRSEVAALVGMAMARPHFDHSVIERVRRRLISFHGGEARTPFFVADAQWNAVAYSGHPYAQAVAGNEASIETITTEDVRNYHLRFFARNNLKVVAAGDITSDELRELLDQMFGDLPERADFLDVPMAHPVTGGRLRVAEMELPQSVVSFGMGSVAFSSPDYIALQVLSHMLGGNSVYSRLSGELRQKRGLTYAASTWLGRHRHGASLRGQLTTSNGTAADALAIVQDEMRKMAGGDISEAEFDDAKSYLIRSYPVELGSPAKIAGRLLEYAMDGFEPDFLQKRKEAIAAMSLDQLKRVAREALDPENLIVSIAGLPALQPRREE